VKALIWKRMIVFADNSRLRSLVGGGFVNIKIEYLL
jgi:hypothetical protein